MPVFSEARMLFVCAVVLATSRIAVDSAAFVTADTAATLAAGVIWVVSAAFVIRHSTLIRHSTFDIRHWAGLLRFRSLAAISAHSRASASARKILELLFIPFHGLGVQFFLLGGCNCGLARPGM